MKKTKQNKTSMAKAMGALQRFTDSFLALRDPVRYKG